jgi:hypothetical protein
VAVRAVASKRGNTAIYISGALSKYLNDVGILRVAYCATNTVIMALVCFMAGGALLKLGNIV